MDNHSDCRCVLRFIIGDGRFILGGDVSRPGKYSDIAKKHGVRHVTSTGLAALKARLIFTTATEAKEYGRYNVEEMKRLLPSWQIETPELD